MRGVVAGLAVLAAILAAAATAAAPRLVARVETGREPCGIAAGFGGIWVVNYGSGTLVHIDPRRNRVTRRIAIGRTACHVTAAFGSLWIARDGAATVVRLDPVSLRKRTIAVDAEPFDAVAGFGSMWVPSFGNRSVLRIDPVTNRVAQRFDVGGAAASIVPFGGRIWVGLGRDAHGIARIDPATGTVERIDLGVSQPAQLAVAGGAVWAATAEDSVLRLDPESGRQVARIAVLGTPARPGLGPDGALWAPAKAANTITRIDVRRNRALDVTPAGPGAFAILNAYGSAWVPSFAGTDVWRFRGS